MPGKPWTNNDVDILKDRLLDGLKRGDPEKATLSQISKILKRTYVAVRFHYDRLRLEDQDFNTSVLEILNARAQKKKEEADVETAEADYGREYINIVCSSRRITTVPMAIKHFQIDMNEWEVDRYKIKTSEGYRKDRQVEWEVTEGKVTKGKVNDTGKMLVVPMFHIQVTLKRKTQEIRARQALEDMLLDARKRAPKIKSVKYGKLPNHLWYELDFPDIHFGKETLAEESGQDYNIEIARSIVLATLKRLLGFAQPHGIERIILPMGNDFFNVDNKENTTTHGTPQQEDTRWQKTFREGRRLAEDMIYLCTQVAPVEVVIVPGNHDEQRAFYLGEVLDARYFNSKHINVDNSSKKRKYLHFGKNLVGFTHGYWEKISKLPSIMPLEEPDKWSNSIHREFHLGDKHHKKDLLHRTEDMDGVTIRILRSLSATDTWHFDKGYIGSPRSAEGFLWDKEDGIVAQFPAYLREK